VIAGAGHTVHLERPDAFLDVLLRWLDRHGHADSANPSVSSAP
jgi:hypothetical protein